MEMWNKTREQFYLDAVYTIDHLSKRVDCLHQQIYDLKQGQL